MVVVRILFGGLGMALRQSPGQRDTNGYLLADSPVKSCFPDLSPNNNKNQKTFWPGTHVRCLELWQPFHDSEVTE